MASSGVGLLKGGFRALSRAAGLADEGIVHERSGVEAYARVDDRKDAIAKWAFGVLRRAFNGQPGSVARIDELERDYWAADHDETRVVTTHADEGVALFRELGTLLTRST
jgi:hypothetical protein